MGGEITRQFSGAVTRSDSRMRMQGSRTEVKRREPISQIQGKHKKGTKIPLCPERFMPKVDLSQSDGRLAVTLEEHESGKARS